MFDEEGGRRCGGANEDDKEFTGRDVLAGKYKFVVTAGNNKDSVWIEVKDDPRLQAKNEVVLAQDATLEKTTTY
jgi:hypothetical protein